MKSLAKKVIVVFATSLVITIFPSNSNKKLITVHAVDANTAESIDPSVFRTDIEKKQEARKKCRERLKKIEEEKRKAKEPVFIGYYEVTAYCPCTQCCGSYSNGVTASGTKAKEGRTVAINNIPFGTHVMFEGHEYINEDHGGGLGNSVIDLYMESHADTIKYGRHKHVKVYIKKGSN